MVVDFTYPSGVILLGILVATLVLIVLSRISTKIVAYFQLYPEAKGILPLSLKLISWGVSGIVFLLFLRFALQSLELNFTAGVVEDLVLVAPQYILAIALVLAGFYVSRMVKEKSSTYSFDQKNRVLFVIDFIIHMTFFFTALAVIGIETRFFELFYVFVLGVIGIIVAITVGLALGVPIGLRLYAQFLKGDKSRKR